MLVRLEKEGAVMQQWGVPSLPSAVTTRGSVYNYALQNDLKKKKKKTYHLSGVRRLKPTNTVSNFQWGVRGSNRLREMF